MTSNKKHICYVVSINVINKGVKSKVFIRIVTVSCFCQNNNCLNMVYFQHDHLVYKNRRAWCQRHLIKIDCLQQNYFWMS
jgi:hypothetical protein